ncbi:hypothetical protein [Hahella sp. HN01]|uniref:hypothetical protein n=1 Tax=Hahella sp. HN01 TaxID=2847262 RepID=UPI001C1ED476|nr:hypothetical protein [Hahella sp. HN01]
MSSNLPLSGPSQAIPPEKLNAMQRRQEMALILAHGIVRLRELNSQKQSKVGLAFQGLQSVHPTPSHREKTEKK